MWTMIVVCMATCYSSLHLVRPQLEIRRYGLLYKRYIRDRGHLSLTFQLLCSTEVTSFFLSFFLIRNIYLTIIYVQFIMKVIHLLNTEVKDDFC